MEQSFWQERWAGGRIGFHRDASHPALERHWQELRRSVRPQRVLVPLCGKARDLLFLRARGVSVVGVEFVRQALVELAEEEQGLQLKPRQLGGHEVFESDDLQLWVGDFFDSTLNLGSFDFVFDRAALVAVRPERRAEYARQLANLVRPGGAVLLVTLVCDLPGGPPHSVPGEEVRALFESDFSVRQLESVDLLEKEPRFRERGAREFAEVVFQLDRAS